MRKIELHWKIIIGMVAGILFGFLMNSFDGGKEIILNWIAPFGTIFIRLLRLIAIPLILVSLTKGITDQKDIVSFKNIGLRSIILFTITTAISVFIGLTLVNSIKPGVGISEETIEQLIVTYADEGNISSSISEAEQQRSGGPLKFLVEMVPENIFNAMGNNTMMLQVIVFSVLFGISMLLVDPNKTSAISNLLNSLNEIILSMVNIIMLIAPFAVFALLAQIIVSSEDSQILIKLLQYGGTVVLGLTIVLILYLVILRIFAGKKPGWFVKGMAPAQLLAFSTSSSAAALPVTIDRVTNHLGIDSEVANFVLPIGATVNMNGTSLYQGIAAVFIAQALHIPLDLMSQVVIVLTALMASIGAAAVPGAGMIMLVVVLESIGIPADKMAIGLALVFAIDRPLDMYRSVINITGDAMVSVLVSDSLKRKKNREENRSVATNKK